MHLVPQLLALAASLCFAACFVFARRGLRYSNPVTMTLTAFALQVGILGPAAYLTEGLPHVSTIAVILFTMVGVLVAIVQLFNFAGVAKIGAARASSLRATFPLFSVAIAIAVLGEPATPNVLAGTLLVVSGIVLISWQPGETGADSRWWHVLMPLFAAFLAGVIHPLRRYALTLSNYPIPFAALVGLIGFVTVLASVPFLAPVQKPRWMRRGLLAVVGAGGSQSAGFLLINIALGLGPVVHVIPIIASFPMWVLLGTVLFLRDAERVNLRTTAGTCLTIAGTIVIILG